MYSIFDGCQIIEKSNIIYMHFLSTDGRQGAAEKFSLEKIKCKFNDDIKFLILQTLYYDELIKKYEDKNNPQLFAIRDLIYLYYNYEEKNSYQ